MLDAITCCLLVGALPLNALAPDILRPLLSVWQPFHFGFFLSQQFSILERVACSYGLDVKCSPQAPMLEHSSQLLDLLWENFLEVEPGSRKWAAKKPDWRVLTLSACSLCFLDHWVTSQVDYCMLLPLPEAFFQEPSLSWLLYPHKPWTSTNLPHLIFLFQVFVVVTKKVMDTIMAVPLSLGIV